MKNIALLVIFLFFFNFAFAQDVQIFVKKDKYGLKGDDKEVVKAKYDSIFHLESDLYAIKQDSLYGIISSSGRIAIQPEYTAIEIFLPGTYFVKKNNKSGLIDRQKSVLLPLEYTGYKKLSDYLYEIKAGDKSGIINKYGVPIIPCDYKEIKPYCSYSFTLKNDSAYGLIDNTAKFIHQCEYEGFQKMNNFYNYVKKDGKVGMLDGNYNFIIKAEYDSIVFFDKSFSTFLVMHEGKKGITHVNGEMAVPCEYNEFEKMDDLEYKVTRDGKIGIMDYKFNFIIPTKYDSIQHSVAGRTLYLDNKIGFKLLSEKFIEPEYENILFEQPEYGLIVVESNGKFGFVTREGVHVPPVYNEISRFSKRIAFVEKEEVLMGVDLEGKEIPLEDIDVFNSPNWDPFQEKRKKE